ncbi:MAG: hypothetical protein Q4D31_01140 [Eubacteriales bacterium]|nr:hypothetical protein [Eubacteriales bacterium]
MGAEKVSVCSTASSPSVSTRTVTAPVASMGSRTMVWSALTGIASTGSPSTKKRWSRCARSSLTAA